ncbi:hypothetical protein BUZ14_06850 [Staphylococcus gallinarum]|uniref:Membrane protein YkvI n=1 Tax=Staphylococcus gallinarum TaxID=1293 RepID=A0A3A0VKY2_STAGA|nr:hypothetical protein [Staphylococcus gallinarum]RIP34888.1 hypothetical protein BUZ14_06850 [Staphylococcus gallinarum]
MNFKEVIKIAFAFVGVVVGAGFATGQEIMQFFTVHGNLSFLTVMVTGIVLTITAISVLIAGFNIKSNTYKAGLKYYFSNTLLVKFYDILLTIFILLLALIMSAGGISTLQRFFNFPITYSALLFILFIGVTLLFRFDFIVKVLGGITPFLIVLVLVVALYSILSNEGSSHINFVKKGWLFDGINYGSLQIIAAFSFLFILGGNTKSKKDLSYGGLLGGVIITFLLMMINILLLLNYDSIKSSELPSLDIAFQVSPIIGKAFALMMLFVIYNTVVSFIYAFITRFSTPRSSKYYMLILLILVAVYFVSMMQFSHLVANVFPIMGYLSLVLVLFIVIKIFKNIIVWLYPRNE